MLITLHPLFEPLMRYSSPRLKQPSHLTSVKFVSRECSNSALPLLTFGVVNPCFPDLAHLEGVLLLREETIHSTFLMLVCLVQFFNVILLVFNGLAHLSNLVFSATEVLIEIALVLTHIRVPLSIVFSEQSLLKFLEYSVIV